MLECKLIHVNERGHRNIDAAKLKGYINCLIFIWGTYLNCVLIVLMPWTLPILKKMGVQVTVFNKDLQRYFVQIVEQIVNSRKAGDTVRLVFIFLEKIFSWNEHIYTFTGKMHQDANQRIFCCRSDIWNWRLKQWRVVNHSIHVFVVIKATFPVSRWSSILSKVNKGLSGTVCGSSVCHPCHILWNGNIVILTKVLLLAAPKVSVQSETNMSSKWANLLNYIGCVYIMF